MLAAHLISFFLSNPKEDPIKKVDWFLQAMRLQDDKLKDISVLFQAEMKKGLSAKTRAVAAVKMLPTHVCSTFNSSDLSSEMSTEKGQFLALDLGESNFKVQRISLGDGADYRHKGVTIQEKIFSIPKHLLNGRADELFNFVSRSLKQFMHERNLSFIRKHPLAFTFLFPVSSAGTNACYMEELRHIDLVEGDESQMCINSEWGAFGDDGALDNYITEFDREIDAASTNPGIQSFEKMVSSIYLGELVRLAVLKMTKQGLLFKGCVSNALKIKGKITTTHLAAIEDTERGLQNTRTSSLGWTSPLLLKTVLLSSVSSPHITVAVDGELYKRFPLYSKRLQRAVQRMVPETCVRFVTSPCGTGTGAALVTLGAKQAAWQRRQVDETLCLFKLSQEQLIFVKSEMRARLESDMKMLPLFVYNFPDGTECGQYLGLELEETRVRAVLVNIRNGQLHHTNLYHKIYEIPRGLTHTSGEEFFDNVAQCVSDFLDFVGMKHTCLPAAIAVSFPCEQTAADKGSVLNWTKCVKATGCEDVVTRLQEAIDRRATFDLDIVAVVNDTVGTMIATAHDDPLCEVGLTVGTGVNICYMEEWKITKYAPHEEVFTETKGANVACGVERKDTCKQMICMNTQCGRVGENGSLEEITTTYDTQVDLNPLLCGKKRFEKLTSGLYLGEVVRLVLLDLARRGLLFRGHENTALKTPGLFHVNCLSQIESDRVGVLQVRSILQQLGVQSSCHDCVLVKEVCCAVSRRAAQLCGAALAAVVDMKRETRGSDSLSVTVAADGELYKTHPHFSRILKETMESLAHQCSVTFRTSEEGSGKGAVLIAATARPRQQT
ncbi:hypothetical protein WMY93_013602 [Mugilogobius chulae]|uniref:hexokinase n=1 Tax=Mugilogobius chulae TaxID=88201 RepID=A0AAW0P6S4_9GOBI